MKISKEEEINDILDNAMPAFNNKIITANTINGIIDDDFLDRQKNIFLRDTLTYFKDSLVKVRQEFPEDDKSEVRLTSEFFILPRKEYLKLKQLLIDE